ncbi:HNH endonuclease signature motif containing protein [Aerococcus urinae]|uniref:HNH endonuclease signature motif containing protein n=1 Tax=Aerococcus urinae TaxID=1376 RepID=UPI00254D36F8|nr:HNH endonuclease signature motif containing protein [Aerococcus urinae]
MSRRLFTDEIEQFIKDNVPGYGNTELTELVNSHFGTSYSKDQIKALKQRNHWSSGLTGQFEKGQKPWNKGLSYNPGGNSVKTRFKKGQAPINHRPVGSERITRDGYIELKVAEPNRWELKHRYIWTNAHGDVPKSHIIVFIDGDPLNCELSNLRCVSRAAAVRVNQNRLLSGDADWNGVAYTTGELLASAHKKRKDLIK